jgi:mycothiol synthase
MENKPMLTTVPLKRIRRHTLRAFTELDFPALASLYIQHDMEFLGDTNFSEERLRADFASYIDFDAAKSVRIAEFSDGTVVGAGVLYANQPIPVRPNLWLLALPEYAETVLTSLLEWGIKAAKEECLPRIPENARIVLQAGAHNRNTRAAERFTSRGMTSERAFYSMLIRFEGVQPALPLLPDGIRLVTFAEHPKVEDFARALKEGFADHRGSIAETPLSHYVRRVERVVQDPDFDPKLYWLALDADTGELAGICTSTLEGFDFAETGFIHQHAVLPAYRRRGLAGALLQTAFGEHFRRGRKGVSLGVDASSLTDAVAVYERAGMTVAARWDIYELELRPGEELSKQ